MLPFPLAVRLPSSPASRRDSAPHSYCRQFTGSVFTGVSMIVRALGDDLGVLVGQRLRSEFLNPFRWDFKGSGDMRFAVAFGRERLDHRDLFLVKFGFQVLGGNSAFHSDLLRKTLKFDARIGLPDSCSKFP